MRRLARYVKPYLFLVVIAVVLLFVQAYANLSLPNYMSDIVNVGIQQGGIQSSVPTAVRQSEMDKLVLFMSSSEHKQVLADYELVKPGSAASAPYLSQYPVLAKEAIYVRRPIDSTEIDAINPIMGKAFLVVAGIEEARTNPAAAKMMSGLAPTPGASGTEGGTSAQGGATSAGGSSTTKSAGGASPTGNSPPASGSSRPTAGSPSFALSQLPPNMNVFALIKMLPASRRIAIASAIDKRFAAMGPKMISQASAAPVKAEYKALGVDFDSRNDLMDEYMRAMKLAWTGEDFSFEGTGYTAVGNRVRAGLAAPQPLTARLRMALYRNGEQRVAEIAEQIGWRTPDAVVAPIASGATSSGGVPSVWCGVGWGCRHARASSVPSVRRPAHASAHRRRFRAWTSLAPPDRRRST